MSIKQYINNKFDNYIQESKNNNRNDSYGHCFRLTFLNTLLNFGIRNYDCYNELINFHFDNNPEKIKSMIGYNIQELKYEYKNVYIYMILKNYNEYEKLFTKKNEDDLSLYGNELGIFGNRLNDAVDLVIHHKIEDKNVYLLKYPQAIANHYALLINKYVYHLTNIGFFSGDFSFFEFKNLNNIIKIVKIGKTKLDHETIVSFLKALSLGSQSLSYKNCQNFAKKASEAIIYEKSEIIEIERSIFSGDETIIIKILVSVVIFLFIYLFILK